jgi:type I restriction enzyme M protein
MNNAKVFKQYFTPGEVAEFVFRNTPQKNNAKVIDPAAGRGVFLKAFSKNNKLDLFGVDIDKDLVKANPSNFGGQKITWLVEDGLSDLPWPLGTFDVAVGNPPFSSQKNKREASSIPSQYTLRKERQAVEILFLERFFDLTKEGGYIRVVLPINIFSNTDLEYVRAFILDRAEVEAIISLPRNLFHDTPAKTAILFARKKTGAKHGLFATDRSTKLILFKHKKEIAGLSERLIHDPKFGIRVDTGKLLKRMDPDYHYADLEIDKLIKKSKYDFAPLSAFVDILNGFAKYGDCKSRIYTRDSIPKGFIRLLRARDFLGVGLKPRSGFHVIKKTEDIYHPAAVACEGDVIFVRVGVGCAGRALWVSRKEQVSQVDDWMFILRGNKLSPGFLALYLNSSIGKLFIDREKQGTGTVSISKGKLSNVLIPKLPLKKQKEFALALKAVYRFHEIGNIAKAKKFFAESDNKMLELIEGSSP